MYLGFIIWLIAAILLSNISQIYEAIGQDEEVAVYAIRWVQLIFPFFVFEVTTSSYHSFAGYQCVNEYKLIPMAVSTLVQVGALYIFCGVHHMGFDGVCLANGLMYFSRFVTSVLLVKYGGKLQP